ncbi:hypothetical protein [Saccharothrix deserti]|uniref:hypothetical protein n=1 Tax=Saccharothrix deserti TaxID=2593674 RepID=UPI00131DD71E|nr:hypothetical protein [Saccharothrix deserti]
MRKPARLDSARAWCRSGAQVTVGTFAKRYGVDRYTAYEELTAIGFPLPATTSKWARRPPPAPRTTRRHTDDPDDTRFADPDWAWGDGRRMFVVGHTAGGAPFGCWEDELEDSP